MRVWEWGKVAVSSVVCCYATSLSETMWLQTTSYYPSRFCGLTVFSQAGLTWSEGVVGRQKMDRSHLKADWDNHWHSHWLVAQLELPVGHFPKISQWQGGPCNMGSWNSYLESQGSDRNGGNFQGFIKARLNWRISFFNK